MNRLRRAEAIRGQKTKDSGDRLGFGRFQARGFRS